MNMKNGLPPGMEPKRRPSPPGGEGAARNKRQMDTFKQIQSQMPHMVRGQPVAYSPDGLMDVPEPDTSGSFEPSFAQDPRQRPQMSQELPSPQPPQQQESMQHGPAMHHPVIKQLLSVFGLKQAKKHFLNIKAPDGTVFKFTMCQIPDELATWALREASNRVPVEGDQIMSQWFQLMISSLSIVAINDTPLNVLFGLRPSNPVEAQQIQEDPYNLPVRMKKAATLQLSKLIWTELQPFGDKIYEFYEKIVEENRVISSFDEEREGLSRYVCPLDGCSVIEFLKDTDEEGNLQKYYCKVHKTELIKTFDVSNNDPLV